VPLDIAFPMGILLCFVVYFMYSRASYEKNTLKDYEKKFEQWKKNNPSSEEENTRKKEFLGVVYKKNNKIFIELEDKEYLLAIEAKKFILRSK